VSKQENKEGFIVVVFRTFNELFFGKVIHLTVPAKQEERLFQHSKYAPEIVIAKQKHLPNTFTNMNLLLCWLKSIVTTLLFSKSISI